MNRLQIGTYSKDLCSEIAWMGDVWRRQAQNEVHLDTKVNFDHGQTKGWHTDTPTLRMHTHTKRRRQRKYPKVKTG